MGWLERWNTKKSRIMKRLIKESVELKLNPQDVNDLIGIPKKRKKIK